MIKKNEIQRDFFAELNKRTTKWEKISLLKELEAFLCDSEVVHERMLLLSSLTKHKENNLNNNGTMIKITECRLLPKQYEICVQVGFIEAFRRGSITVEDALAIPHNIDAMNSLSATLFLTHPNDRAECWNNALKLPEKLNSLLIDSELNKNTLSCKTSIGH